MALPLITSLNAAARRAFPIIQAGVKQGMSSRAINESIKTAFGVGIRRQTLLDIMRAETGIERAGAALRFISPRNMPNPRRLPQAVTRIRRHYSFVVRVTGHLIDTGLPVIQNVTVALDTLLTRGEIERMAENMVAEGRDRYMLIIESSLLVKGVQSGELGTLT